MAPNEPAADGSADERDPADESESRWPRPVRPIVAAGRWIADTFRGYAGMRELKRNRR